MANELVKDQAPLAGVVMCCTSIAPEQRHLIATAAEEMGGTHKFDLTSDVTHLIVGEVDTPKYKYVAKERPDVKAVLPSFVDVVRQAWMEGGDVDLRALEAEHRVPTFMGLRICLTGFESTSTRESIRAAVVENGGDFHGDLTREVTHLIVAAPEGKKYEAARRWDIKTVALEWLQDSLQRKMVLEESLYDPILAPQDRGKNAFKKAAVENVSLGKRPREDEKAPEPAARRKLRRTMSKKMESQQEKIWEEIAAGSGQAKQDDWQPPEIDSVLGALPSRDGSAEATPEASEDPIQRKSIPAPQRQQPRANAATTKQSTVVFMSALFTPENGYKATQADKMAAILEERGAQVFTDEATLRRSVAPGVVVHVVVPAEKALKDMERHIPVFSPSVLVTDWWIESCYPYKHVVDPGTHVLCEPFESFNVSGFGALTICSSGFTTYDLLHVSKAIKLMGAKYDEFLKAGVDMIVFNTATPVNKEKLDFAAGLNIIAVTEQWLVDSIYRGAKQNPDKYPVQVETPTVPLDYEPTKPKTNVPRPSNKSRTLELEISAPTMHNPTMPSKQKSKSQPGPKVRPRGPFFEDDDDDADVQPYDGHVSPRTRGLSKPAGSHPLGEMSQEQQNSQRHGSPPSQKAHTREKSARSSSLPQNENFDNSSAADQLLDVTKMAAAGTSQSAAAAQAVSQQKEEQMNNAIAHLLAAKESAARRFVSGDQPTTGGKSHDLLGRRRRGPLGRAASGGSFGSLRAESVHSSIDQDERRESAPLPDPSQKIIYEDEKAQEERRALIKRMGGQLEQSEEVRKAQSVGVVKDTVSTGSGLGARARRKR